MAKQKHLIKYSCDVTQMNLTLDRLWEAAGIQFYYDCKMLRIMDA